MEKLHKATKQLHQQLTAKQKHSLRAAYEEGLESDAKNAVTDTVRAKCDAIYKMIAQMKGKITKSRSTVTAKLIYLAAYGDYPRCSTCGTPSPKCFGDRPGYREDAYCSKQCATIGAFKKVEAHNLATYGVKNVFSSEYFQNNRVGFLQRKFGQEVTGPTLAPGAKEKIRKTSLEKFGVSHFARAKEVQAKRIKTNRGKYGTANPAQNTEVKDKMKASVRKRLGVDHPSQAESVKLKKIETCRRNFGVDYPTQSEVVRTKTEKTNLQKYGAKNPMQNSEVFDKQMKHRSKTGTWRKHKITYQGFELAVLKTIEHDDRVLGVSIKRKALALTYKEDGEVRTYYPDFRLLMASGKTILVEVKGHYTLGCDRNGNVTSPEWFSKNQAKFKAAAKTASASKEEFILALYLGKGGVAWIRNPQRNLRAKVRKASRKVR